MKNTEPYITKATKV